MAYTYKGGAGGNRELCMKPEVFHCTRFNVIFLAKLLGSLLTTRVDLLQVSVYKILMTECLKYDIMTSPLHRNTDKPISAITYILRDCTNLTKI